MNFKHTISAIVASALVVLLAGSCGKKVEETVSVSSVTVSPESVEITEGESATLTAKISPASVADRAVTWTSSDNSVATVDGSGNVQGLKAGTAIITATAEGKSGECNITVSSKYASAVSINGGEIMTYEAGHLRELFEKVGTKITSIKWQKGFINSSDAGAIREYCTALESADMKDVRIISGGDSYKSGFQNRKEYTTTDDEFPPALFYGHNTLKSIILPGDITKIGDSAFESCVLDNVVFPDSGLEIIGAYAFSLNGLANWKHSKLYDVPSSIKKIEYYSFCGVDFGDRLYLPNIESLDETAFIRIVADEVFLGPKLNTKGPGGIEVNRVIIDESHPQIYVTGQAIVDRTRERIIGWAAGRNHSSVSSLTIPAIENVTTLGDHLLGHGLYPNCKKITVSEGYTYLSVYSLDTRKVEVLDLPSTLERINVTFVAYNKVLKDVTIRAAVPPTFNDNDGRFDDPFHECDFKGTIRVPAASIETYKTTKYWSKYADQYVAIEE